MNDDRTGHTAGPDDGDLRATAARLGRAAAERLDVDATARVVLARLRERPNRGVWNRVRHAGVLRLAAAVALLIGGAIGADRLLRSGTPERTVAIPAGADLDALDTPDLEQLLASFDEVLQVDAVDTGDDLGDLTEEELRTVLQLLEG